MRWCFRATAVCTRSIRRGRRSPVSRNWGRGRANGRCCRGPDCHCYSSLASAASGVWLFDQYSYRDQANAVREVSNLCLYSPEGAEQLTFSVDHAYAVAGNAANLYVLVKDQGQAKVQRYNTKGVLGFEFPVDPGLPRTGGFPEGSCSLLVVHQYPSGSPSQAGYPVLGVDTYDPKGTRVKSFGTCQQDDAEGTLLIPTSFVAAPQGDVYVSSYSDISYITHFRPNGQVAEVLPTSNVAFYNVYTKKVEFLPSAAEGVDRDGTHYTFTFSANWKADATPTGHYDLTFTKVATDGTQLGTFTVHGPEASPFPTPWQTGCVHFFTQEPDGSWRLTFHLHGDNPTDPMSHPGVLWVGKLGADFHLHGSWQTAEVHDMFGALGGGVRPRGRWVRL